MNVVFAVGCKRYDDPDVAGLSYADEDAQRFAKVVAAAQSPADVETVLLHDQQEEIGFRPTRGNILRHLSRGAKRDKSTEVDLLFFFFSGHGFRSQYDETDYLLASDSSTTALEDTAIPFGMLERYLRKWEAKHIVLFIDACRAAAGGGKTLTIENWSKIDVDSICPPGMVTFCSCRPGQSSYEADIIGSGVFTHGVCRALGDEGRCSTVYELDEYLSKEIPRISTECGKPAQEPYSRVEPLALHKLLIVSERNKNAWRARAPVQELRHARVEAPSDSLHKGADLCAIDFGTSYSSIAVPDEGGQVSLVPSPGGPWLVPSVVTFLTPEDYVVGWEALERMSYRPHATLREIKRRLVSGQPWQIEGRTIEPEFAASLIIGSLKRNAEEFVSTPLERVLVSAPANFTVAQTSSLVRAFELAGLRVARIVSEPAAASLCLWEEKSGILRASDETEVLVVDLGGGTLDVAVVEIGGGISELKSYAGDNRLGGIDFDEALAEFILHEIMTTLRPLGRTLSIAEQASIRQEAERAKIVLGTKPTTYAIIQRVLADEYGFRDLEIPLNRDSFRDATRELNDRVEACIRSALDCVRTDLNHRTDPKDLGVVLLAGQGSRIFTVAEAIERTVGKIPQISRFQEAAVVRGLCYQAGVLQGMINSLLFLGGTHRGIGIKVRRDEEDRSNKTYYTIHEDEVQNKDTLDLVRYHTTIPTRKSELVRFEAPHQKKVRIQVVEMPAAESEMVSTLGVLDVEVSRPEGFLEVVIEIDANDTIDLGVLEGWTENEKITLAERDQTVWRQLNNFFLKIR